MWYRSSPRILSKKANKRISPNAKLFNKWLSFWLKFLKSSWSLKSIKHIRVTLSLSSKPFKEPNIHPADSRSQTMLTYTKILVSLIQYLLLTVPSRCQVLHWDGLLGVFCRLTSVIIPCATGSFVISWTDEIGVQPVSLLYITTQPPDRSSSGG